MKNQNDIKSLEQEWEQAAHRAAEQAERESDLGELLTEGAGLNVKSGVRAGGLWGTTGSCTCNNCVS